NAVCPLTAPTALQAYHHHANCFHPHVGEMHYLRIKCFMNRVPTYLMRVLAYERDNNAAAYALTAKAVLSPDPTSYCAPEESLKFWLIEPKHVIERVKASLLGHHTQQGCLALSHDTNHSLEAVEYHPFCIRSCRMKKISVLFVFLSVLHTVSL